MANISSSRGFNSSYRGAQGPSAFYEVLTSDFGAPAPGVPTLTYFNTSGSIASSTASFKITWITQEGVSAASAEASVNVSSSSGGGVNVVHPTVPTGGQTVIGWQIYSATASGAEKLDNAATSSSPAPVSITTNSGIVTGYLVNTTTVLVENVGSGSGVPAIDQSGIQPALPSVAGASTADYYFIVPNSGSLWKTFKPVYTDRPDEITETSGISISLPLDCYSPLYPGATPGSGSTGGTNYTQVSVAPGTYMVMNQTLFVANQTGSQNTAATFIGGSAFAVSKGTVVTDGSVTWLCLGKAVLVKARFNNVTASAATPTPMIYCLYES